MTSRKPLTDRGGWVVEPTEMINNADDTSLYLSWMACDRVSPFDDLDSVIGQMNFLAG